MRPNPKTLTPGVIDGYAESAFSYGACGALAIALHDATGWPVVAITDAHNTWGEDDARTGLPRAGGGSALHWTVRRPSDGRLIDIDGAHDPVELVDRYAGDADDGEAVAALSTRADCVEWYVEAQGEPIPIRLAATFVDAVLERANRPQPRDDDEDAPGGPRL